MKNIAIIIFTFISLPLKAQENVERHFTKVSTNDSIGVTAAFQKLIKVLENKDQKGFLALSLDEVDCSNCRERFSKNDLIAKKRLFKNHFADLRNSDIDNAIKKRGFHISGMEIKNYKSKSLPKDFMVYEIWIVTLLPNELEQGFEGQSNTFQFVKIENKYKLFGLTSVP